MPQSDKKGRSRPPRPLLGPAAVATLLAGAAIPTYAANSSDGTATATVTLPQPSPIDTGQNPIVVTGQSLFPGIRAERSLDQQGIASYGVSTVDELLGDIENNLGSPDEDEPMVIVNGQPINDLNEIGTLPVEALRNLQVLPRGAAVRLGGSSRQRVISLTLRSHVRTVTMTAARKLATAGDWAATRGEAIFTAIHGSTRANLALRLNGQDQLLESQRGIIEPQSAIPYAIGGNVIAYPDLSGEIDTELSAADGKIVTVAPVPAVPNPTLADFAAGANDPATTDFGRFRTLSSSRRSYDLNGSVSTKLASWLTSTATIHLSHTSSNSLRGLPSAVLVLPENNPFSPFSTDVAIAVYGRDPLCYRAKIDTRVFSLLLNGRLGSWTANFNAQHSELNEHSTWEQSAAVDPVNLGVTSDPFVGHLSSRVPVETQTASTRSISNELLTTATGPLVAVPAGAVVTTVEGRVASFHLHGSSNLSPLDNGETARSEESIRAAVEVPLASRAKGFLPQLGELSATAEYTRGHYSDSGILDSYAYGLTWEPIEGVRLRGSLEARKVPPSVELLGSPAQEIPNVPVFDPLTGTTVDVTEITGGSASLEPETDRIHRLSALIDLVERWNLQLNAEYTDTDRRNFVSSLPDESAAVMLAFPDRFIRDSSGTLTAVDLRPVNFDSERQKSLRWGLSMNRRLAGGGGQGTYVQLGANHTMVFSDRIDIQSGLSPVDLLNGGAIGIGGGTGRHQIDANAAITSSGLGARIGVAWRGSSKLAALIDQNVDLLRFSPVAVFNLRAFAEGRRVFPHSSWAKGLRFSVDVVNLTNDRQRVRDSFGHTPLQYQPGYRDPIGRTIEVEIRKVF